MKRIWIVQVLAMISVIFSSYDVIGSYNTLGILVTLIFLFVDMVQTSKLYEEKEKNYSNNTKKKITEYCEAKKKEADNYCVIQKNLVQQQKQESENYYNLKNARGRPIL